MNSNKEKAENNAGTETQLNQFKHKRVLLKKFLNEPVDALDLRLAKAEENLSELPIDPFTNIRHEESTISSNKKEVEAVAQQNQHQQQLSPSQRRICNNFADAHSHEDSQKDSRNEESKIQRVIIQAGNNLYNNQSISTHGESSRSSSGWRISPIPWRMMLPPDVDSPPEERGAQETRWSENKRSHEDDDQGLEVRKRIKTSPPPDIDDIDRRISLAECSKQFENPLVGNQHPLVPDAHVKQENETWLRNIPREQDMVSPTSDQYIQRYHKLVANEIKSEFSTPSQENAESGRLAFSRDTHYSHDLMQPHLHYAKNSSSAPLSATSSQLSPGSRHYSTPYKPQTQRQSSVIVRNTRNSVSAEKIPDRKHLQDPDVLASYQHFPPMPDSLVGQESHVQEDWIRNLRLRQLETIRSNFTYKMMECHRRQQLEQGSNISTLSALSAFNPHFHPNTLHDFQDSSKESEKSKFSPRSLHTAPAYYRDSFLSATNSRNNKIDQQKRDFGRTCSATVTSGTETESQDDRGPSPEVTSTTPPTDNPASSDSPPETSFGLSLPGPLHGPGPGKGKRGRPRKHAPKLPLPPLYVFIRNLLHNPGYNPSVIAWVEESSGCFKVTNTLEFAKTWGQMKSNRSEEMNYEKMSRAMRYHYGCERQGRKGHLAMVKEKRLYYKFGELAKNWRVSECSQISTINCSQHSLCKNFMCLWSKE